MNNNQNVPSNEAIENSINQASVGGLSADDYIESLGTILITPMEFYPNLKTTIFNPHRFLFFSWCQKKLRDDEFKNNIHGKLGLETSVELKKSIAAFERTEIRDFAGENKLVNHDLYWHMYELYFAEISYRNLKRVMDFGESKGFLKKEPLIEYLSEFVPNNKMDVLKTLLNRWEDEDYISFMHIFGHVIEMMLIENERIYGDESLLNKRLTIGGLIHNSKIYGFDEKNFLLFVLSKENGLGLRNKYVHFRSNMLEYSKEICWIIIYVLIWLTKERSEEYAENLNSKIPGVINIKQTTYVKERTK